MGLIHIYSGDGKGKTTAAIGLAVRAAGRGKKVLIARFLKNDDSGEVAGLKQINGIQLLPCEKQFGFFFQMTDKQKEEAGVYYLELFKKSIALVKENVDLLILDEIMAACNYQLVEEQQLVDFLQNKPKDLEVVLTGRNPSEALIQLSNYHSEIKMRKHPYEEGIAAREGIEY